VKPWKKKFGTLGLSRDRKSVMEIAQNYRKTIFCELPANRLSPEKRGNFHHYNFGQDSDAKTVCRYLVWFSQNINRNSETINKKQPQKA
jgi:hypothetical protein